VGFRVPGKDFFGRQPPKTGDLAIFLIYLQIFLRILLQAGPCEVRWPLLCDKLKQKKSMGRGGFSFVQSCLGLSITCHVQLHEGCQPAPFFYLEDMKMSQDTLTTEHAALPYRVYRTAFHGGGLISRHHNPEAAEKAAKKCRMSDCVCGCAGVLGPGEEPKSADENDRIWKNPYALVD